EAQAVGNRGLGELDTQTSCTFGEKLLIARAALEGTRAHIRRVEPAPAARLPVRRRWTLSSEIAAGVTPGMRAAWPRECGFTRASRSRTSAERPLIAPKSRSAGTRVSSRLFDWTTITS